ncbi:hypothetical protein COCSADRAFT_90251 [Bipolaris sorokiniana ND90Pr]|uniref:Uncharacterized protein n=1 Tax=Cochliobolus sativus (strain ND90Pr / ATCC 201652) TaxID=665912 RepID=M2T6H5_COCSN|nr:uncharacterized protein COCSADRAFT_90251 [Bipolaris sorokiniana ND90Pr]EMD64562.1 hypothetical protein COCSADRAFT_90251 [Bipolaris sorokiniana ND90Pr]
MTVQLRISSSKEQRPIIYRGNTRRLLRLSDVPDSPKLSGAVCEAVESDGRACWVALKESAGDIWCYQHHDEWRQLSIRWTKIHKDAERMVVTGLDTGKQKILKLRQSVDLRREIQERFYPRGGDIQDYIKWINKMENDVRQLADSLLMANLNRRPTPETPGIHTPSPHPNNKNQGEKIMILRSPLDPRIPINSLDGLPDDGTILVLKHFYQDLCADSIRRLYAIVPDLDDSNNYPNSPGTDDDIVLDAGTEIIRAWFRIMVLNDSEAGTLEHATRSKSISEFLMGCQASQLEMYCDFFEKAWRPHAVQYLRVAICAQTLAGGDIKTIRLLGGTIPSTTEGLRMTKPCWDILYQWFPTLLTPWTIASICSNFEDYTTICKLLMLKLYNDYWYDSNSILGECATGVYMDFIPMNKGDFTSSTGLKQEDNVWVQRQSRNYLCGQMAIGHPMTKAFLDELRKRTASLYLVVYEGTHADATVHPTEPDLFISRHRTAANLDELDTANFTTTLTLEEIKNELRMRKNSMYDPIVVDSWQFIIIDREVGLPFRLIDIVQDTLFMLVGDPSPRQMAKRVIREVIPPSVQEIYLEKMQIECSSELRYPPPGEIQHEGNRWRTFDPDANIIAAKQKKTTLQNISRDNNRFIRRFVEDLERYGIVSLVPEYEEPQTRPVIVQGTDGAPDLYFPYLEDATKTEGERAPTLHLPPRTCLSDFAQAYRKKHPNAIMAKGSIQTHYCAWPMPAIKSLSKTGLNFATWEGHVYRWNAMPFDRPSSANAWQYYIQHFLNSKYPFVMFYLTTFVICATDQDDAERKMAMLLDEMEDRGWRVTLPRPHEWTGDVEGLRLDTLYNGIKPA